ncbi:MAG: hypothetical protein G01um10147_621 [Microgenomates group bacterium Gr01-1014_7]|nr:MAG: hypothetical protein G01um10147_621 [Microgenomates group bacterium Gr01-1014_7]
MSDTEPQPNQAHVENPQESLRDKIMRDLSARPDIDEIIADVRIKLSQPPPEKPDTLPAVQKPPGRGISRRKFLLGLAGSTALGFISGKATPGTDVRSILPESLRELPTIFNEFIKPLIEEAARRRKQRAESDPNYYHRVDRQLNEGRINILLYGSGIMLRPGLDPGRFTANQILSIALKKRTVDLISITSETRAPNVERYYKQITGENPYILSINNSFEIGGFDLMRETFEQATGLSMDFQMVFSDATIKNFVDEVLGGKLDMDIPYDHYAHKIFIDGVEYPAQQFKTGRRSLNSVSVVQYMKGETAGWEKGRLPHHRKHHILDSLINNAKGNLVNPVLAPAFLINFRDFLNRQTGKEKDGLVLDFDLNTAFDFDIFNGRKDRLVGRGLGFNELRVDKKIAMMNADMGGVGIRYVSEDAKTNPVSDRDFKAGIYPIDVEDATGQKWSGVALPYNGNPHADDLVSGYWIEPRKVVKETLATKS